MQSVRPGTAASCFKKTTDRVEIHEQKVGLDTAASCLTKTTDRAEIHEKGEAMYIGKLFHENEPQSET